MSQETSSIFLNYYLLHRFRGGAEGQPRAAPGCGAAKLVFATCFVAYRGGLNTWGTYYYVANYRDPEAIARNAGPTILWLGMVNPDRTYPRKRRGCTARDMHLTVCVSLSHLVPSDLLRAAPRCCDLCV